MVTYAYTFYISWKFSSTIFHVCCSLRLASSCTDDPLTDAATFTAQPSEGGGDVTLQNFFQGLLEDCDEVYLPALMVGCCIEIISMALCKTAVSPLLAHFSFALNHDYNWSPLTPLISLVLRFQNVYHISANKRLLFNLDLTTAKQYLNHRLNPSFITITNRKNWKSPVNL